MFLCKQDYFLYLEYRAWTIFWAKPFYLNLWTHCQFSFIHTFFEDNTQIWKEQHSFYNYGRGTALYFLKQPFLDNFPLLFILFPEDSCLHDHKIITAATICELLGLIIFWLDSLQCRCVPLLIIETILVHMKFIKHLKTRKWFISSNKNKNKSKLHSYINVVYTDILEVTYLYTCNNSIVTLNHK